MDRPNQHDAASFAVAAVKREIPGLTTEQAEQVLWLRALTDSRLHHTGRRVKITCADCGCYGSWRHPSNAADWMISGHRGHYCVIGITNPPSAGDEI